MRRMSVRRAGEWKGSVHPIQDILTSSWDFFGPEMCSSMWLVEGRPRPLGIQERQISTTKKSHFPSV